MFHPTPHPTNKPMDSTKIPYIPPMSDIDQGDIDDGDVDDGIISEMSPKFGSSPSAVSISAVLFEIKDYESNQEGVPIISNDNKQDIENIMNNAIIGETLIKNKNKYNHKRIEQQDAEPDPINYDENHWNDYRNNNNKNDNNEMTNKIGCKLRVFQCLCFLSFLLGIIGLLTDNLITVTGEYQYENYNDTIICGWNGIHLIEYDLSLGIIKTNISYKNYSICHKLLIDGWIWLILIIISIITLFIIFISFLFNKYKTIYYRLFFLVLNIIFQVIAVIVWLTNNNCNDKTFINNFYDKNIESIKIGLSIDIIIASMICVFVCCLIFFNILFK